MSDDKAIHTSFEGRRTRVNGIRKFLSAIFVVTLLAILAGLLGGCGSSEADTIVIGAVYPFTGNVAVQGNQAFTGADIAREIVNEQGGVLGKQVTFEKVDAPNPAAATNETQRLITEKKVKLVIGSYSSSISIAASAVCERNQVVWSEMGGMSNDVTDRGFKYTFRTTPTTGQVGYGAAHHVAEVIAPALGIQPGDLKIALIHEDSAFGTGVMDSFIVTAKDLGLNVIMHEPYSAQSTDLAPLVLKLKSVAPDIIVATQYLNDQILFAKQSKEMNLYVKAFIGTGGTVGMKDFADAMGESINGIMEVDGPSTDINRANLNADQAALVEEFVKRYEERVGSDQPPTPATNGFLGTMVLLTEVIPKAGSIDPDKIREAYMALDIPEGDTCMGFGVKIGDDGQNQRTFMIVRQWQNGRYVVVSPAEWATAEISEVPLKPWSDR